MARKGNKRRDDGRISVQVYIGRESLGFDVDGKELFRRKYKTVYGSTQSEAEEKANNIKAAMRKGLDVTAENDTFQLWAERWLKMKAGEVSKSRMVVCEANVKHLTNHLGDMKITKIKTSDIQDIISDLAQRNPTTKKPTSHDTLSAIRGMCKSILQLAIDNRVMDYNPAGAVKIPKVPDQNQRRALNEEEQRWILETEHPAQRAGMIMMYSGLRRGELIPLTWSDVDLDNASITVNKTVEMVKNEAVIKTTAKTESSIRVVDIPQRLVDFLSNEPKDSIYVCPSSTGSMHTKGTYRTMWNSYLRTLNEKYGDFTFYKNQSKFDDQKRKPMVIPNITPHWLRHTFATMLYFAGYDVKEAMEQLGHADMRTTLQIYTHLDAKHKRKAMEKLNKFLNTEKRDASQMQVIEDHKPA